MHVQSCCFAHKTNCFLTLLLPSSLSLVKVPSEQRRTRTLTQDNDFLFLFLNFDTVSRIQLQKNLPTFDELNELE